MSIFSNPASSTPADIAAYVAGLLDLLGDDDPVVVLRQTPAVLQQFLDTVSAETVATPEAPGKWSIREVVQHWRTLSSWAASGSGWSWRTIGHRWPATIRISGRAASATARSTSGTPSSNSPRSVGPTCGSGSISSPTDLVRVGIHGERGEESLEHMRRLYAGHDVLHLPATGTDSREAPVASRIPNS